MVKVTTDFTSSTKNTTDTTSSSKTATDISTTVKLTSDFAANSAFESGATWDSATVDWGSALVSWDGADGVSPLRDKSQTDITSSSKITTDFT